MLEFFPHSSSIEIGGFSLSECARVAQACTLPLRWEDPTQGAGTLSAFCHTLPSTAQSTDRLSASFVLLCSERSQSEVSRMFVGRKVRLLIVKILFRPAE